MNYLVGLIAVGAAVLLILWIRDRRNVGRRFHALEAKVGGEVVPFWRAIQSEAIDDLTHPHDGAERADELLQLLKANPTLRMTDKDRAELERRMATVAAGKDPMIQGEDERDLARVFPVIMRRVQKETANPNPITDVQIVGMKKGRSEEIGEDGS